MQLCPPMGIPLPILLLPLSMHKGETAQDETEKEENANDNEHGWPRGVGPSGGRDASLVVGDLIFNTQALG